MEELYAILLLSLNDIISEKKYYDALDKLFTYNPENEDLLYLEWEKNILKTEKYFRNYFMENNINRDKFGKALMDKLREVYNKEDDIIKFTGKTYSLWRNLPGVLQYEEPFYILNHADDPIYYNDKEQSRQLCETALNYYQK